MNSKWISTYFIKYGKIIFVFFILNLYVFSQYLFKEHDLHMKASFNGGVFQVDFVRSGDERDLNAMINMEKDSNESQEYRMLQNRTKNKIQVARRPLKQNVSELQMALKNASLFDLLSYPPPQYIDVSRSPCFFTDSPHIVGSLRCLPTVFLAGFAKSGTTDLHKAISQHQHVVSGFFKEPQYWYDLRPSIPTTDHYALGGNQVFDKYLENYKCLSTVVEENYVRHQPIDMDVDTGKLTPGRIQFYCNQTEIKENIRSFIKPETRCPLVSLDSSPMYLYEGFLWENDPANYGSKTEPKILTPHRIKHFISHPKIIVLMRNPVERLFSDFKYFTDGKKSGEYFDMLITNGIAWWNQCIASLPVYRCAFGRNYTGTNVSSLRVDRGLFDWGDSEAMKHNGANRLRYSIYVIYIKKWLQVFPQTSFLFVKTEEYANEPLSVLTNEIFPFLNLEPLSEKSQKSLLQFQKRGPANAYNKANRTMLSQTRRKLDNFFKPYNEELCKLLGSDKFMWY